jgi:hypothetical protein
MTDKKTFPLEKILTVSAREYVESRVSSLFQYDMVGVHVEIGGTYDQIENRDLTKEERELSLAEIFARKVPKNTEVVVDYTPSTSTSSNSDYYLASGTALIPKPKKEEKWGRVPIA